MFKAQITETETNHGPWRHSAPASAFRNLASSLFIVTPPEAAISMSTSLQVKELALSEPATEYGESSRASVVSVSPLHPKFPFGDLEGPKSFRLLQSFFPTPDPRPLSLESLSSLPSSVFSLSHPLHAEAGPFPSLVAASGFRKAHSPCRKGYVLLRNEDGTVVVICSSGKTRATGHSESPPPTSDIVVMDVKSALTSLKLTGITANQLIDADKEDTNLSISSGLEQTNSVVKRHLNDSLQVQSETSPPYKSTVSVNPVACSSDEKARRLKIRDLVRKEFPDGILEAYHTTPQLTQCDLKHLR